MNRDKEQYREAYRNTTPAIKMLMESAETTSVILKVAEKYKILGEKIRDLSFEVGLILLKIESKENLEKNLIEQLGVASTVANSIATEITASTIFSKITGAPVVPSLSATVHSVPTPQTLTPAITPTAPVTPPASPLLPPTAPVAPIAPHVAPLPQENVAPTSIFEEKLKRVFTVPRADARLSVGTTSPTPLPSQPTMPTPPVAPVAPSTPTLPPSAPRTGVDPYREPAA